MLEATDLSIVLHSLPTYLINSGLIENAGTNNKKHCFQSTDTYYQ